MISLIIVANTRTTDYISGYLASVKKYQPDTEIVVIDTTEEGDDYRYCSALNRGAAHANGDWLIFSNDDVLVTAPFRNMIERFDPSCIYSRQIRHKGIEWGAEVSYVYGYIIIMHRSLFEAVGPFDEEYIHAGFDDIDYCWRAMQAGYKLQAKKKLPFVHLADLPGAKHRRYRVPGYQENMARSKELFLEKVRNVRNG